ncbi:TPA: hypothetical protein ACHKPT_004669 [Escherichia coli]
MVNYRLISLALTTIAGQVPATGSEVLSRVNASGREVLTRVLVAGKRSPSPGMAPG